MIPPTPSLRDEIRRLERLRQEEPGTLAFARLAEAYRAAGRYELALEVLETGIEEGPSHPAGHLVRARVHHDLGEPRRERRALERALAIDPENRVARRALADLDGEPGPEPAAGCAPEEGPEAGGEGDRSGRASHSPEERRELLAQLDRVSSEDWWESGSDGGGGSGRGSASDEEEVVTETMGHLYARQGLWKEAETIYGRLCRARPDDDRLARCLESVREQEVPERPPRRETEASLRTQGAEPGPERTDDGERPVGSGENGGSDARRPDPDAAPTMRSHLQALLRGGGARPARPPASEVSDARTVARRIGGRRDEDEGGDAGMEELLRRWRRAARKGDDR